MYHNAKAAGLATSCFYLTDEECKFWCDNARSGDRTRFYLTDEECKLASAIPAPAKIPEFLSN